MLRLFVVTAFVSGVALPSISQTRFPHFGTKAAGMGGAFTAVANDTTAFYWNPAGYAFGPVVHGGVQWGESEMNRDDGATSASGAAGFALGFTFMGVAGTFSEETSSRPEGEGLWSQGIETFDLSVSILQSLPLDDLVIAGNIHYLRGESHELFESLASLGPGEEAPTAVRDRVLAAPGLTSSRASVDLGALYQPRAWMRFGIMGRRLLEPGFSLPSGQEVVLPRHTRAGAVFFLPRETTVALDFDVTSQGSEEESWREISFGAEKRFFDDVLSLRGGVRAETGSGRGARPAFSAGVGVRIRFVVAEVAYQGATDSRDESLWFSVTVSP